MLNNWQSIHLFVDWRNSQLAAKILSSNHVDHCRILGFISDVCRCEPTYRDRTCSILPAISVVVSLWPQVLQCLADLMIRLTSIIIIRSSPTSEMNLNAMSIILLEIWKETWKIVRHVLQIYGSRTKWQSWIRGGRELHSDPLCLERENQLVNRTTSASDIRRVGLECLCVSHVGRLCI